MQVEPNHILCGEAVSWAKRLKLLESLADDDGHERRREVGIGGNKSIRKWRRRMRTTGIAVSNESSDESDHEK